MTTATKHIVFLLIFAVLLGTAAVCFAKDVYVGGHLRLNGTYVAPHYRSRPDGNFWNNWSTWPNVNPYTGKIGTRYYPPLDYGLKSYPRLPSLWSYPSYSYRYSYRYGYLR
ncbi:MAG: hypothetical protein QXI12_00365 [Candidatus Methanomethyliaceae archaeon]